MRLIARATVALLAVATVPAIAQTPDPAADPAPAADDAAAIPLVPEATPGDPFEKFNRGVWGINQGLDKIVIKPVTVVYRFVTPRPARRGISAIFANLNEPWSFINNLLQGKAGRAANNLGRFVVNTTLGVGGLADHATGLGIKPAPEDFGQTLAKWGVKNSAYLVLPLLGPSTVRDGIGSGVAMVADPYPICLQRCTNLKFVERLGIQATEVISIRSDLTDSGADAFLASSLDPYATARSAYFQSRAAAIANKDGESGDTPASLDPTAADAPPVETPPADPAPAADPGVTPPATAPKLSFNLSELQG